MSKKSGMERFKILLFLLPSDENNRVSDPEYCSTPKPDNHQQYSVGFNTPLSYCTVNSFDVCMGSLGISNPQGRLYMMMA